MYIEHGSGNAINMIYCKSILSTATAVGIDLKTFLLAAKVDKRAPGLAPGAGDEWHRAASGPNHEFDSASHLSVGDRTKTLGGPRQSHTASSVRIMSI